MISTNQASDRYKHCHKEGRRRVSLKRFITDIGSKSFIKSQNCTLVDRSELFKLLVWFMMEDKLYRVSTATYRDREFYGRYNKLKVSMFVSVKIAGLGKV
jgi:hypothetical protein